MIEGGADRTLIGLTLHTVQLQKLERIDDKNTAMRELRSLSRDGGNGAGGEWIRAWRYVWHTRGQDGSDTWCRT